MIEIQVEWAGHKQDYSKRTEEFCEKRLSYIKSVAPTPWKGKTNYSSYTIFDAEGKKIATLPNGEKDTNVNGGILRDLFVVTPQLFAEVLRLQKEIKVLSKYRDIVEKYDDALLADGDTDPRWSELYD